MSLHNRYVPQVNLLAQPPRVRGWLPPLGSTEIGAIGCSVLILAVVAFFVGVVLGWHPHLGGGQ